MAADHDITTLNSLIETTLDSVKGFSDAAEDTNAGTHAAFFSEMAQERSGVATRLQALVAGLGGDPEDDSSYGAAAHRGFMNLKEAIMGSNERAEWQATAVQQIRMSASPTSDDITARGRCSQIRSNTP